MISPVKISNATHKDLRQIKQIADNYALAEKRDNSDQGFLVSCFTMRDYENFLSYADYFYVTRMNDQVKGFLLAYSNKHIKKTEWLNNQIKESYRHPFILIKQICVDKSNSGSGIASQLYRELLKNSGNLALIAAIVLEPRNDRSIRFHQKLGFQQLLTATPADGMLRGIWAIRVNEQIQLRETEEKR